MFERCLALAAILLLTGCSATPPSPQTVTMVIESSPTSLDPRIGVDSQSEHITSLIFDSLVHKNAHFNLDPWLATSWETPDPLTYRFHLRTDVHFHNGKPLTATDVKYTLDSMRNGTVITAKAGALARIDHVDAPDAATIVIHLKQPDAALLWNLSDGAIGIVPAGSGSDFAFHPIGSGPFRFVSQLQDDEVIIERNDHSWQPRPAIARIRFAVVPDAITRALELEKGSADVCINCLTADMVSALAKRPNLQVESGPGTNLNYISFNTQDSVLRDLHVRQAIAYAMNRPLIISSLWRGRAQLADSLLPPQHWAFNANVEQHGSDPAGANALLDQAGYRRGRDGIRFHIAEKISDNDTVRLVAAAMQQQLAQVGIAVDLRSFEFATFYSDLVRGAFQIAPSRWIGGNENPDIYRYAYASTSIPPHGSNRGYYSNPEVDRLIADATATFNREHQRDDYARIQQILAHDLPTINLWYLNAVVVHDRRLSNIHPNPSGTFDFLRTATLQ